MIYKSNQEIVGPNIEETVIKTTVSKFSTPERLTDGRMDTRRISWRRSTSGWRVEESIGDGVIIHLPILFGVWHVPDSGRVV